MDTEVQLIQREPIKETMKTSRLSPKMMELIQWEYIGEVNRILDSGATAETAWIWATEHGFKIGRQTMYNYNNLRKRSAAENVSMERILGIMSRSPLTSMAGRITTKEKLKSELDALDMVIQRGYDNLVENKEQITAATMMAAIKLKNELTEGTHGFLTSFGMERLREIESNKYALIVKHLLSYIPKDLRDEAISTMAKLEEDYYFKTDYYEEYLRSTGDYSEEQIQAKLDIWKNDIILQATEPF